MTEGSTVALSAQEYKQFGKHVFVGGIFLSNFAFLREVGYFDLDAWTKPLLHLWSLGVEEQFYIVWPLLLYASWKMKSDFFRIIIGVAIFSYALSTALTLDNKAAAFYLPITRFWELLLGGLLAHITLRKISIADALPKSLTQMIPRILLEANIRPIIGAVLITLAVLVVNKQNGWWGLLLPTVGACLIISSEPEAWLNRTLLSHRLTVWFGLISYPLYLWHWPLLSLLHITEGETPLLELRILVVLISLALAWLTLQLFEKPIRLGGWLRVKAVILSALMIVVASLGLLTYIRDGIPSRSESIEAYSHKTTQFYQSKELENGVACKKRQHGRDIPDCLSLASDTNPTVALVGDSHAEHLFFGLSEHYKKNGDNLVQISACLPLSDVKRYHNGNFDCESNSRALDYVKKTKSIKTVILSFRGAFNIEGGGFGDVDNEQFTKKLELISKPHLKIDELIFREGLHKYIDGFIKTGKEVIFIIDNPELGFDPKYCIDRPLSTRRARSPCAIEKSAFDKRNARYLASVSAILLRLPTVKTFYTSQYLCDAEYCWGMKNDKIFYMDDDHLSYDGSILIGERFSPTTLSASSLKSGN